VTGERPGLRSQLQSFGMTGSYYFEGDQVRAARAADDAHLRRPAGGREHVPGGMQVRGGEARAEPQPHLLFGKLLRAAASTEYDTDPSFFFNRH